jgi:hypothetical protein
MRSQPLTPAITYDRSAARVAKLLEDMRQVMNDTSVSDVLFLLEQDDGAIHAHRVILKNRCTAFDTRSGSICSIPGARVSTTESGLQIVWPNTSASTLTEVLKYIYTGAIEILDRNVFAVYSIAQDMGINELEEECKRYIRDNMTIANACVFLPQALQQSKRFIGRNSSNHCNNNNNNDDEDFLQLCTDFIGENASQCLKTTAFLDMEKDAVIHIIASDSLAMAEEDIWRSVLQWAKSKTGITDPPQQWSEEQRKRVTSQLSGVIEHVRILQVSLSPYKWTTIKSSSNNPLLLLYTTQIESQVFAEEVEPTGAVPMQIR